MALRIGAHLGPYEVTALLGAGGMGEVYKARDTRLKRDVALKFLSESVSYDHERLGRFQREAEISASLNHPNIAAIHGLEESDGYSSTRQSQGGRNLFRRAADAAGPVERLTNSTYQQSPWAWSQDEKTIVFQELHPGKGWHISTVSRDGGDASALIQESGTQAAISPDGRWIAYQSSESGSKNEVWVRPFPKVTGARWQISTDGGSEAKWAANGRELFYRRGSSVMRVSIETEPGFRAGRPERLFETNNQLSQGEKAWDLAPDGRFVMKKPLRAEYTVNVVLNWQEELKQRVPTR